MTIKLSKPYRRANRDLRAFDVRNRQSSALSGGRPRRNNDGNWDKHSTRSKRTASQHGRDATLQTPQPPSTAHHIDQTNLTLDVIHQPTKSVQLGVPVDVAVALSLNATGLDGELRADDMDTSDLLATASLVAERCQGERVPLQTGFLTAPTLFDTVHPIQEAQLELRARTQCCRTILGYLSFPGLLIRQAGTYRIRTTLMRMGFRGETGATCLVAVDSQPIKVERHGVAA